LSSPRSFSCARVATARTARGLAKGTHVGAMSSKAAGLPLLQHSGRQRSAQAGRGTGRAGMASGGGPPPSCGTAGPAAP
jgi:hypothetical protein